MIGKAALIVSLLLNFADGCGKVNGGGYVCDIRVNVHPHHVPGKGRGTIEAAVKAWCDQPPTEHRLYVRLEIERDDGKRWEEVAQSDPYPDARIPTPNGIIVKVTAQCVDGIFRVYARAEGRGPDPDGPGKDKRFNFPLPENERYARSIKCPDIKT
ncbi:MAG TPA: hypothetical protein VF062_12110 [Candidatus Limnocylindrales bacterium]